MGIAPYRGGPGRELPNVPNWHTENLVFWTHKRASHTGSVSERTLHLYRGGQGRAAGGVGARNLLNYPGMPASARHARQETPSR